MSKLRSPPMFAGVNKRHTILQGSLSKLTNFETQKVAKVVNLQSCEFVLEEALHCTKKHYQLFSQIAGARAIIKVLGHQYQRLTGGYDLAMGHF